MASSQEEGGLCAVSDGHTAERGCTKTSTLSNERASPALFRHGTGKNVCIQSVRFSCGMGNGPGTLQICRRFFLAASLLKRRRQKRLSSIYPGDQVLRPVQQGLPPEAPEGPEELQVRPQANPLAGEEVVEDLEPARLQAAPPEVQDDLATGNVHLG